MDSAGLDAVQGLLGLIYAAGRGFGGGGETRAGGCYIMDISKLFVIVYIREGGGGMPGSCIDWDALRAEYVAGEMSQRELAQKHGISAKSVQQHSSAEGWTRARADYRKKTAAKGIRRAQERDARSLARLLVSVDRLTAQIERALGDGQQMHRHVLRDEDGAEHEEVLARADWQAVRLAASAVKDLTATARDLLGIRSAAEEDAAKLAWARYELDKAKAGADETEDEGTGVVLLPEVLPETEAPAEEAAEDGDK